MKTARKILSELENINAIEQLECYRKKLSDSIDIDDIETGKRKEYIISGRKSAIKLLAIPICDNICIHGDILNSDGELAKKSWTVTHVKTGAAIKRGLKSTTARKFAKSVSDNHRDRLDTIDIRELSKTLKSDDNFIDYSNRIEIVNEIYDPKKEYFKVRNR